jgi:D-arabinose 1-dehydrogenase-like Zn-dependent alcohol dehydrogenase
MRNSTIRVATFAGPGAEPVIRSVPWPQVPANAALIQIGACGVCGTDLHILKGHWPKPLPWPFTLGHELGGVIVEKGGEFTEDFMGKTLGVGSKVMIPPLMPCGQCYYCVHYPQQANKCLTPVYYGRYLGSTSRRICGEASRNTSMSTSTCCRGRKSTSCPTTCRCGWGRCRSR